MKRLEAQKVDENGRKRRKDDVESLAEKYENPRKIERAIFQDEKYFPLNRQMNRQRPSVF